MRRTALFAIVLLLPGCTGFGTFLDHTFSAPGYNPNIPMTDSENVRRALGRSPTFDPLGTEPGNVWPDLQEPTPTLADIQQEAASNGRSPTPRAEPDRQPRRRGSSTPPGSVQPSFAAPIPNIPQRPAPRSFAPGPGPLGRVVPTPGGPAVDSGGTSGYRQLTTPRGPGAIMVPNGNGTSTIINPDGTVETVPTPR